MNYNVNALVNADLTEKQQSYGTQNLRELTTVKYLPTAEASDKANWVGLGLYLENKVAIRGYFDTDLTNGIYVKVTYTQATTDTEIEVPKEVEGVFVPFSSDT